MYFINLSHSNTVVYLENYSIKANYNSSRITINGEVTIYGSYSLPDKSIIYSTYKDGVLEGEGSLFLLKEENNLHKYLFNTYLEVDDLFKVYNFNAKIHLNDKGLSQENITFSNNLYTIFNKNLNSIEIKESFQIVEKKLNKIKINNSFPYSLDESSRIITEPNNGKSNFLKNKFNYLSFYTTKDIKVELSNSDGYNKIFSCSDNSCLNIIDWKDIYYFSKDPYFYYDLYKKINKTITLNLKYSYRNITIEDKVTYSINLNKDFFNPLKAEISNE